MIPLAADENFDGDVLDGLKRRIRALDVICIQDTSLQGAADPDVLAWASEQGRVLLTHDRSTLSAHAYQRMDAGLPMAGVIQVPVGMPIGAAIDDLELIVLAGQADDFKDRVLFLPL